MRGHVAPGELERRKCSVASLSKKNSSHNISLPFEWEKIGDMYKSRTFKPRVRMDVRRKDVAIK